MHELKEKIEIDELFVLYSNDVFRYSLSLLRNVEESKDIVQEVFLKFQLSENEFRMDCNYKTWLFKITRNLCFNKLKAKQNNSDTFDDLSFTGTQTFSYDDLITLKDALAKLTPDENELIYLRDFEKYSYKELADMLNVSIDNIKVRLFRTKQKLRKILER